MGACLRFLRCLSYGALRARSKAAVLALMLLPSMAAAERVDILALGDSLTQGYGLIEQEGFVPQLRAWLADRGVDARVVNAGVSGDTTAGGAARVEWSLDGTIDAMIVALGGNDLLRGIDPASSRDNLAFILDVAQQNEIEVLLVGLSAPGNYGPEFKEAFDSMYPELAEDYGTLYLDSFFAGLMEDGAMPEDMGEFMQHDGIHPNAKGVKKIVEGMGPHVIELIERTGVPAFEG